MRPQRFHFTALAAGLIAGALVLGASIPTDAAAQRRDRDRGEKVVQQRKKVERRPAVERGRREAPRHRVEADRRDGRRRDDDRHYRGQRDRGRGDDRHYRGDRHRVRRDHGRHYRPPRVIRHHAPVYRPVPYWRGYGPHPWHHGARRIYVDRDPFFFHAGFGIYLGGLALSIEFGNRAPDGYLFYDPYCRQTFVTLDAFHHHCRGHRHEPVLSLVAVDACGAIIWDW